MRIAIDVDRSQHYEEAQRCDTGRPQNAPPRADFELESCAWFSRDELRSFGELNGPFADRRLPNKFSIARYLVNTWLAEG